jgi:signal transduction histidine kinase
MSKLENKQLEESSDVLLQSLQEFFTLLGKRYNSTVHDELLKMTVQRITVADGVENAPKRLVVATSQWALSMRGRKGLVEAFILPATEIMNLPNSELPSRAKLRLKVHDGGSGAWMVNDVIVTGDEMNALMRGLFKDVVGRTRHDFDDMPEPMRLIAGGQSFAGTVRSLVAEKHALVQKIVDQQEAIQNNLARDLHDVVLGNVMLLRRSVSGGKLLSADESISVLDEIAKRLRDVCQELSPRDLKDCGLRPMIEELCSSLSTRVGCHTHFICPDELPDLPQEVSLHIYRIAQECFNNVGKHASASEVTLSIELNQNVFTMTIADNGVGYDTEKPQARTRAGGSGASIIRERAELIGCIYPARVWFDSQQGKGAKLTLEIMVSHERLDKKQA